MEPIRPKALPLVAAELKPLKGPQADSLRQNAEAVKAAEQFETMMTHELIKSMREGLPGGNLIGEGVVGDIYSGMAEWELARVLSHNAHLGLKDQILRQLPKGEEAAK
jgi:Rod binding domain-containing protein